MGVREIAENSKITAAQEIEALEQPKTGHDETKFIVEGPYLEIDIFPNINTKLDQHA